MVSQLRLLRCEVVCGYDDPHPQKEKQAMDFFRAMGLTDEKEKVLPADVIFNMILGNTKPQLRDLLGLTWLIHISFRVPLNLLLDEKSFDLTEVEAKNEVTVHWAKLALLAKFLCVGTRKAEAHVELPPEGKGNFSAVAAKETRVTVDEMNAGLEGVTMVKDKNSHSLTFTRITNKTDERESALLKVGIGTITTFTLLQFIDLGCLQAPDNYITTTYPVWYYQPSFNTRDVANLERIHSDGQTPGTMDSLLGKTEKTDTFGFTEYTVTPYRIGLPLQPATEPDIQFSTGLSAVLTPGAAGAAKAAMPLVPRYARFEDVKTCFERFFGLNFDDYFVLRETTNCELSPLSKGLLALKFFLAVMDRTIGEIEDENSIDRLYLYLFHRVQKVFRITSTSLSLGSALSSSPGDKMLRCRILARAVCSEVSLAVIDGTARTGGAIYSLLHKFPEQDRDSMLNPVAGGEPLGEIKYEQLSRRPNVNAFAPNKTGKSPGKDSPISKSGAKLLVEVSKIIQYSVSRAVRRSVMDAVILLISELSVMRNDEKQKLLLPGELQPEPSADSKETPKSREETRLKRLVAKVIQFMMDNEDVEEFKLTVQSKNWLKPSTFANKYNYQTKRPDGRYLANFLCAIAQCLVWFDDEKTHLGDMRTCLSYTPAKESARKIHSDQRNKWTYLSEKNEKGDDVDTEITGNREEVLEAASIFKVCLWCMKWSAIPCETSDQFVFLSLSISETRDFFHRRTRVKFPEKLVMRSTR